ncbi:unnamed protein product [Acidithrix sp. C25]|nr:unnamed protein product [Acidithrix sp. C25]
MFLTNFYVYFLLSPSDLGKQLALAVLVTNIDGILATNNLV